MTLNTAHLAPELEALDAEAAGVSGDPTQPGAAPAAPPAPRDWNAEADDLVTFAKELLTGTWPALESIWTADKCARLARAAAPVMAKYEFDLGRWGPEIMLGAILAPMTNATVRTIRQPAPGEAPAGALRPVQDVTDPGSLHTKL